MAGYDRAQSGETPAVFGLEFLENESFEQYNKKCTYNDVIKAVKNEKSKDKLIHENWGKYTGNVVHYPAQISPYDLQQEIILAITKIYSVKKLFHALLHEKWYYKILFVGEFFLQRSIRANLKRELPFLKSLG